MLSDLILTEFSNFMGSHFGLHFPREKWTDLERGIQEIARAQKMTNLIECAYWLMTTPLAQPQYDLLAAQFTIGETYFFRDQGSFNALKNHILPSLIDAGRKKGNNLRIWSIPCSTGEEPYSIAILVSMLIPDLDQWNISIFASDVNILAINRMKKGIYTDWSFREIPPNIQETYFNKIGNNKYALKSSIKKMVTPLLFNLATENYPSLLNGTTAMDLILCKNLLMYFIPDQRNTIIQKLYDTLNVGGYLVVSASEYSLVQLKDFKMINLPSSVFFKKEVCDFNFNVMPEQIIFPMEEDPPMLDFETKSEPKKAIFDFEQVEEQFHHLANQGNIKDALQLIEQSLLNEKCNADLHYFKGLLLQEMGNLDEAIKEFTTTLYLKPEYVLAHFVLGNIAQRMGDGKVAKQHYANVLKLIDKLDSKEIIHGSEGMDAQGMSDLIQSLMR